MIKWPWVIWREYQQKKYHLYTNVLMVFHNADKPIPRAWFNNLWIGTKKIRSMDMWTILQNLQADGLISARWVLPNDGRKAYREFEITEAGLNELKKRIEDGYPKPISPSR